MLLVKYFTVSISNKTNCLVVINLWSLYGRYTRQLYIMYLKSDEPCNVDILYVSVSDINILQNDKKKINKIYIFWQNKNMKVITFILYSINLIYVVYRYWIFIKIINIIFLWQSKYFISKLMFIFICKYINNILYIYHNNFFIYKL